MKDASIWNANSGTGKATSLQEEYNINREEGGDPELTRFQRNFLTAVLRRTQFLRVLLKINGALGQIQKQKKYTYQTMRKLMFELLRMVEFLKAYKAKELRINGPLVEGTIKTLLRKTAKKAAQEGNERSVKKFSNCAEFVPGGLFAKRCPGDAGQVQSHWFRI